LKSTGGRGKKLWERGGIIGGKNTGLNSPFQRKSRGGGLTRGVERQNFWWGVDTKRLCFLVGDDKKTILRERQKNKKGGGLRKKRKGRWARV